MQAGTYGYLSLENSTPKANTPGPVDAGQEVFANQFYTKLNSYRTYQNMIPMSGTSCIFARTLLARCNWRVHLLASPRVEGLDTNPRVSGHRFQLYVAGFNQIGFAWTKTKRGSQKQGLLICLASFPSLVLKGGIHRAGRKHFQAARPARARCRARRRSGARCRPALRESHASPHGWDSPAKKATPCWWFKGKTELVQREKNRLLRWFEGTTVGV